MKPNVPLEFSHLAFCGDDDPLVDTNEPLSQEGALEKLATVDSQTFQAASAQRSRDFGKRFENAESKTLWGSTQKTEVNHWAGSALHKRATGNRRERLGVVRTERFLQDGEWLVRAFNAAGEIVDVRVEG